MLQCRRSATSKSSSTASLAANAATVTINGFGFDTTASNNTVTFNDGAVGAVSVIKAVYVDRRSLKCACVGGSANVPLGFVSLTENLMMIAMAVWMAAVA